MAWINKNDPKTFNFPLYVHGRDEYYLENPVKWHIECEKWLLSLKLTILKYERTVFLFLL